MTLAEIAALFRGRCDAVFMCEHDRGFTPERLEEYREACARASERGPLLVPGIEYAGPEDRIHVPVWGPVPFLGEEVPTGELLRSVARHGGFSLLAHPVRRDAWELMEGEWLELARGVEIWTRKWDGWAPTDGLSVVRGGGPLGVVSLDLHRAHQRFPLSMELELEGPLTARRLRRCAEVRPGPRDARAAACRQAGARRRRDDGAGDRELRRPAFRRVRELRDGLSKAR